MSNGIIALIVAGSFAVYAFGAGATWALLPEDTNKSDMAVLATIFWPLVLAAMLGARLVSWLRAPIPPKATAREVGR